MKFIKRSLTGKYDYYSDSQSDIRLVLVRCDYNPNQPRDEHGRWASGGGGGGGGSRGGKRGSGKRSSGGIGGASFTVAELSKKKISKLEEIAKEVGAATPKKYPNRKSSWIEEIQKVQNKGGDPELPKPIIKPGFTVAELSKKKISKLEEIAKEVGAATPTKYKNRKSSWIEEIQKVQGKEKEVIKPEPKPLQFKAGELVKLGSDRADHKQLINLGNEFLKDFQKDIEAAKPTEAELKQQSDLLQEKHRLFGLWQESDIYGFTDSEKRRIVEQMTQAEKSYSAISQKIADRANEQFLKLRKAIATQTPLSKKEAADLVERISFDSSIPKGKAARLKKDLADFFYVTGGKGSSSIKRLQFSSDRAWASESGGINTGSSFSRRVLWHEAGHHQEFESLNLEDAANSWMRSRATSQLPEQLSKLTGISQYGDNETALPDNFVDPYVGKVYSSRATEVISVGIEHFHDHKTMKDLYEKDPEHFAFMVGSLLSSD